MKDTRSDKEIGVCFCGAPVIGAVYFSTGLLLANIARNYETCVKSIAQLRRISSFAFTKKISKEAGVCGHLLTNCI